MSVAGLPAHDVGKCQQHELGRARCRFAQDEGLSTCGPTVTCSVHATTLAPSVTATDRSFHVLAGEETSKGRSSAGAPVSFAFGGLLAPQKLKHCLPGFRLMINSQPQWNALLICSPLQQMPIIIRSPSCLCSNFRASRTCSAHTYATRCTHLHLV